MGVIFLFYFTLKSFDYPKTGIALASIVSLLFSYIVITDIYRDELFSKSDVEEILFEQSIELRDGFELIYNKSTSGIGDYYHTFILNITILDKERVIHTIKTSKNFNIDKLIPIHPLDRTEFYSGPKKIKNYETDSQFVREIFKPQGIDYAPTWCKIKIDKKENKLIFENLIE